MSSHTPYPQEEEDEAAFAAPTAPAGKHTEVPACSAATAPAGKPQDTTTQAAAQHHQSNDTINPPTLTSGPNTNNDKSSNAQEMLTYVTPLSVAAAAAPPVRTVVEVTQTTSDNPASAGPGTTANRSVLWPKENNTNTMVTASADGMSVTTTTRVTTLQPNKIVYYYADNTAHTYVLSSTTTTTTTRKTAMCPPSAESHMETASNICKRHGHGGRQVYPQQQPKYSSAAGTAVRIPNSHGGDSSSLVSFDSSTSNDDDDDENANENEKGKRKQLITTTTTPCANCGHCACLATVYKPPEYVADITPANPRIGSPGPVTLFAFGFTTCLYNVHQAGICPMNLTTMGLICFYGGLAQFVGGWFELINKNTIFCTLDVTYGAFWMATAITNLVPENSNVTGDAPKNYMGGFFMLWFFFAGTMFVSSFKFSYVQMLLNLSVTLNFLLNFLGSFIGSKTVLQVAGYEGIVEGCLATYVGMAFSMRDIYGHSILPLFFQKNFRITEW